MWFSSLASRSTHDPSKFTIVFSCLVIPYKFQLDSTFGVDVVIVIVVVIVIAIIVGSIAYSFLPFFCPFVFFCFQPSATTAVTVEAVEQETATTNNKPIPTYRWVGAKLHSLLLLLRRRKQKEIEPVTVTVLCPRRGVLL